MTLADAALRFPHVRPGRRLSQAISEGDGISLLAVVDDASAARAAEEAGAEGLVVSGAPAELREATELPILWMSDRIEAAAGADACVVDADGLEDDDDGRVEHLLEDAARAGLEWVVAVADEDELRLALDRLDPEIFLLSAREAREHEALEHVLGLLPDVPAGKLAIAELAVRTRRRDRRARASRGRRRGRARRGRRAPRRRPPAAALTAFTDATLRARWPPSPPLPLPQRLGPPRRGRPRRAPVVEATHTLAIGVAVFTSGAVLLGMELAASRVLAPYFGNSLFVWGALIGVVLAGLSVGYWLGGTLADRLPATQLLLGTMTLGALLVLAHPDRRRAGARVGRGVGSRAAREPARSPRSSSSALRASSSPPVSPIAIRLAVRSVDTAGRTAGRLYAISTAGSIAGTLVTAFWLIPELGVSQLLAAAATVLLGAVVLVALAERLPVVALVATGFAVAAAIATASVAPEQGERLEGVAAQNWSPLYRSREEGSRGIDQAASGFDVVFQEDTRYHHLAVVDDADGSRYLRFDNSFQSGMTIARPFETRFPYTDYFGLGLAYNPDARNVLFVGLGGASAPKRFWRDFPSLDLQVVELDPVVADVARRYFAMPDHPRLKVAIEDGRRYLQRNERRYDVIALDAYFSDSIPFHLATREFVELVRDRLAPGGVVVANIIGSVEGPGSKLFRSFVRTYRTAFPTVAVHPVIEENDGGSLTDLRNLMLVATEGALPSEEFLTERWRELAPPRAPNLDAPIRDRYDKPIRTEDVPTLTDDYAPTDSLLLVD